MSKDEDRRGQRDALTRSDIFDSPIVELVQSSLQIDIVARWVVYHTVPGCFRGTSCRHDRRWVVVVRSDLLASESRGEEDLKRAKTWTNRVGRKERLVRETCRGTKGYDTLNPHPFALDSCLTLDARL